MPINKRVAELSLAQRHVVEIARALVTRPKVLFLDEPTEPLQAGDVRKLFDLIGELKRDGVGIVYVSHRLHEVDELADRISVMRDGEIIDCRLGDEITSSEIVALIAGRPLGQIFPAKATSVGPALFSVKGLSGRGFDQVDLVVHAGEIVGLAGIEGEGQREFIRAAAGIDRRYSGEVRVKDANIGGDSPGAFRRAGIGFVPDDRHIDPATHLNLDFTIHKANRCIVSENLERGAKVRFSDQGLEFVVVPENAFKHLGSIDYTQRLTDMKDSIKRLRARKKIGGMKELITVNSVIGNINKDKKLHEEYEAFCQKDFCEKIVVNRLESQRVRMRKTTNKGTDVGLVFAQGLALKNGDVVYLTEEKMIIVEIEPESVAVLSLKSDDSQEYALFGLAVRIGHLLGNLHRPIKVVGETVYVPIQADTEIDLLKKIFEPLHRHLDIAKGQIVFEPEEGIHTHEHK